MFARPQVQRGYQKSRKGNVQKEDMVNDYCHHLFSFWPLSGVIQRLAVSLRVRQVAEVREKWCTKSRSCPLTRLHCRVVQGYSVHYGRTTSSFSVHCVDFKVKRSVRIQAWQGESGRHWAHVVLQTPTFHRVRLVCFKEERLWKTAIESCLTGDLHWCTRPVYNTAVLYRLRDVWKSKKYRKMHTQSPQS